MKFIDKSKIFLKSGSGGNGCIAFRREKSVPEGGPNGGDGGNGANIVFVVDPACETLIDFSNRIHFKAQNGEPGKGSNCHGKKGEDLIISIPKGTQIWNEEQDFMFFDAVNPGDKFVLLKGGKGGAGNARFKSSINQTPMHATKGEEHQEMWVWLILKIFADIGYVGFPNAGKSSLLQLLTGSKTKIANYPFTTTNPELGAIFESDFSAKKLTMADLPGIISGAHENKGLGLKFLGHIERCCGILHVIDVSSGHCLDLLKAMLFELKQFCPALLEKKQIIALNKIDLVDLKDVEDQIASLKNEFNFHIFPISCKEKIGLKELLSALFALKYDS